MNSPDILRRRLRTGKLSAHFHQDTSDRLHLDLRRVWSALLLSARSNDLPSAFAV